MVQPTRFLLYIDILGFKDMVMRDPRKVARVYAILNTLYVHEHYEFKTIVFSDTILVYNPEEAESDEQRNYLVWYLTEFAEDLHHRLIGQDIWFRAVLIAGDFNHYRLNNVECFFGGALIDAYLAEKDLPLIGLAMHDSCLPFNQYFRIERFSKGYHFVYLTRQSELLKEAANVFPTKDFIIGDMAPRMPEDVRFFQDIYLLMRNNPVPAVRAKALATWDFYHQRYPEILDALIKGSFSLSSLGLPGTWREGETQLDKNIKYYKRIGSGTSLSMSLTQPNSKKK